MGCDWFAHRFLICPHVAKHQVGWCDRSRDQVRGMPTSGNRTTYIHAKPSTVLRLAERVDPFDRECISSAQFLVSVHVFSGEGGAVTMKKGYRMSSGAR